MSPPLRYTYDRSIVLEGLPQEAGLWFIWAEVGTVPWAILVECLPLRAGEPTRFAYFQASGGSHAAEELFQGVGWPRIVGHSKVTTEASAHLAALLTEQRTRARAFFEGIRPKV